MPLHRSRPYQLSHIHAGKNHAALAVFGNEALVDIRKEDFDPKRTQVHRVNIKGIFSVQSMGEKYLPHEGKKNISVQVFHTHLNEEINR